MTDTNYYRNQLKTEMGNAALNESMSCILLFDKKQQDYGSKNIASTEDKDINMLGVAIRLNDKIQRLMNLLTKRIKGKGEPNNESIKDNARDIHNYGTILALLEQDQWK